MKIVDFHSHILPGADHGSDSIDVTLKQLALAGERDFKRIVATPHFYPHKHSIKSFLTRRTKAVDLLRESYSMGMPEICVGAEVLLCENIDRLEGLNSLTIGGSNLLLLELPGGALERSYYNTVYNLRSKGYSVVLAHVDRYNSDVIEELLNLDVILQINAYSLVSVFKRKRKIMEWISGGKVYALGSDIHKADKRAYKLFDSALKMLGDYAKLIEDKSDKLWQSFDITFS